MTAIPPHAFEAFMPRRGEEGRPATLELRVPDRYDHHEVEAFRRRCLQSLDVVHAEREAFVEEVDREADLPGGGGEAARMSHFTALNELARRMSFYAEAQVTRSEALLDFLYKPGKKPTQARDDMRILALGVMQLYPGFDMGDFVSRSPQSDLFHRSLEHDFGTLCVLRDAHRHVVEGFDGVEYCYPECKTLYGQYREEGRAGMDVDEALRPALMAFVGEEEIDEPEVEELTLGA